MPQASSGGSRWNSLSGSGSGGKPARPQTLPTAHVTFIIDCTRGKQLTLAAPPAPPQVPSRSQGPSQGPVTPSVKTYIVFCGKNQPPTTQGISLEGRCAAWAQDTLPPCPSRTTSLSSPQEVPKAKGNPWRAGAVASSPWGAVKGSLKALSFCVCGQAD
uniref:Steroid receptor associated and regulated protein n=1 Tax=Cavia porcellus TaxID=10141 RepID=A0A286XSR3_CAVPO